VNEKWSEFVQEGDAYLKTARGGQKRPGVFTPEILYNLLAMAIEKHIMAALIFKPHPQNLWVDSGSGRQPIV
jgi:hypothetical protein